MTPLLRRGGVIFISKHKNYQNIKTERRLLFKSVSLNGYFDFTKDYCAS